MKTDVRLTCRWRIFVFSSAILIATVAATGARAAGRVETLQAIQAVENPRDSVRPGRHGELGPYQFRRGTWRMHTILPFEQAVDRSVAEGVAIRHYEWLKSGLERNGFRPTVYNIALAWNGGLSSVVRGRVPVAAHDYAERVNNLAQDFRASRLASAR